MHISQNGIIPKSQPPGSPPRQAPNPNFPSPIASFPCPRLPSPTNRRPARVKIPQSNLICLRVVLRLSRLSICRVVVRCRALDSRLFVRHFPGELLSFRRHRFITPRPRRSRRLVMATMCEGMMVLKWVERRRFGPRLRRRRWGCGAFGVRQGWGCRRIGLLGKTL